MSHDIFIEACWRNDDTVSLTVNCSCGALLDSVNDYQPQLLLDQIVDTAWRHHE